MASINPSRGTGSTFKRVAEEAAQPQQHAKKPKTISVAGLFAKKPRAEPDQIVSTGGITRRQLTAEEILTEKAKRHPAYLDVKEATAAYDRGEAGSIAEQLDAVYEELMARIDGMDINGKSLEIPGAPSDAALKDIQGDIDLFRPLEEDVVTISVTKSDRTVAMKNVKLGDSIKKLENLIEDSEAKLTRLAKELNEVNGEIDATLDEYNKATKSVGDAFQKKIVKYQADVKAFHKWTIDEITKARKEDKAYAVEANRKLQEFAASLLLEVTAGEERRRRSIGSLEE